MDAWLRRDPRHAGALLRAMAGLSAVERALTSDMSERSTRSSLPARPNRRRVIAAAGGAIAATVAGTFGWQRLGGRYVTTSRGEIRRLPLEDGSIATINTGSELRISLNPAGRRIELARGQAWFQVAKDRTRPFIVDAGIAQARAIGTAFSVVRGEDGVQVAVTEGTVAVWPSGSDGLMAILKAGQFANFRAPAAAPVVGSAPDEIERALAWRNGEISLENETLSHAIEQFNRYNSQRLVLTDPSLADERLVGLFKIDKPEDFATMLSTSLDVEVTVSPAEIRIARKIDAPADGKRR
ncbi:FecR family protein [Sphingomonas xinjiangensis]|uniref:Transmembrane sensor n=1 Tax=Sphingomonas xinjiangensis TaxID=643568 RepID=A0A840YS90_9SPHN|nr:FecR domain-containing protein [Sphingomonas xinjiangensis]MBB5712537.1 transmembrane sensor [Sphingomonas xinjiangensis]